MEPAAPNKKLESGVFYKPPTSSETTTTQHVIRTMKGDVSDAIRNQEETVVTIAIAEEKKRALQQKAAPETSNPPSVEAPKAPRPIRRILVVTIIIFFIAMLGLAYVFLVPKFKNITFPKFSLPTFTKAPQKTEVVPPIPVVVLADSIITADSEKRFDIATETRESISSAIENEIRQGIAVGFVKNIFFVEGGANSPSAVSASRLLAFEDSSAPEILTRSLEKEYMVGLLGETDNVATPFIILKVPNTNAGHAGLLDWETRLPDFFDSFFGTKINGGAPSLIKFNDIIISEKDSRIFTSSTGGTIVYAFANPTTIIITTTQSALETLLPIASTK